MFGLLGIGAGLGIALFLVAVVLDGFAIWGFTRIMRQAGHSPHWAWMFLGIIIPFVNFLVIPAMMVLYFVFAFTEWPARRELRELRAWAEDTYRRSGGTPPPPAGGAPYAGYPQPGGYGYPAPGGYPQQQGYGVPPGGYPQQW